MWHIIQVRSPKRSKNQHIVGKLQTFPLRTLQSNETCDIKNGTYEATRIKKIDSKRLKL